MMTIETKGSFENTERFLKKMSKGDIFRTLNKYGSVGVAALASATPVESSKTASSWDYKVTVKRGSAQIEWLNNNINQGVNIAVILQYGHGTGTGGYVVGRDYINPAIRPVFDEIADSVWREIQQA